MAADAERFLAEVRAFGREVVATNALAWASGKAPAPAVYERAAKIGLTAMEVAPAQGGLGLGFRTKMEACAILAAADFGMAMSLVNTHNVASRIATTAPPAVANALLPALLEGRISACTALTEPGAGSDAAAIACTARRVDGGWRLDGEKRWIVNGRHAGLAIVYAQTAQPGAGSGIAAFLVDLTGDGCARYAVDSDFTQTSIGTGGFRLTGCMVPEERCILPAGSAFKAILDEINGARLYVAAMCCAMVSAALREVRAYGETRSTFGHPLVQHQAWRQQLALTTTRLAAAWALVESAVAAGEAQAELRHIAAAAKVHAVALAQTELPALLHAMGAEGLRATYPFARHIAAAQSAALTDGSTAMLLDRLARWDPSPTYLWPPKET